MKTSPPIADRRPLIWAVALAVVGPLLLAETWQSWFSSRRLATQFVSTPLWMWWTGATVDPISGGMPDSVNLSYGLLLSCAAGLLVGLVLLSCGGLRLLRKDASTSDYATCAVGWGAAFAAIGLWDWAWILAHTVGWTSLATLMEISPQFWLSACVAAGASVTLSVLSQRTVPSLEKPFPWRGVIALAGIYTVAFVSMNWTLYWNLLVPHGDSAMYEEHLWNVLHGKGFRSYLDQGLFLGEHVQVVHLALLPLYLIWPSHLLLELCESLAIATGAIPVAWMVFRHTRSRLAAVCVAAAYLSYFPTQFLDIEIDLKTFRPEAFGLPLLLAALERLDARRLTAGLTFAALTLTVKEDYSIVLAMLGLWVAATGWREKRTSWKSAGGCLLVLSAGYLVLSTRVIIPYFRSGAEVHYASYFQQFGKTPEEIAVTILTRPDRFLGALATHDTALYALALLVPLAGLPLLAPERWSIGAPTFALLCLNELAPDPRHQFHAPLVAIAFWALPVGMARLIEWWKSPRALPLASHLTWTSALATAFFFSIGPWSLPFWDFGTEWNWRKLYADSRRADEFAKIESLIPRTARVASTDFVHPRFTHHERSYDYSDFARKVSGGKTGAPPDTDYIVIDTRHPYSRIRRPEEVPEYRDHPDEWELLPDQTDGYFIVLRRRSSAL